MTEELTVMVLPVLFNSFSGAFRVGMTLLGIVCFIAVSNLNPYFRLRSIVMVSVHNKVDYYFYMD